jgi:hypothetical protein
LIQKLRISSAHVLIHDVSCVVIHLHAVVTDLTHDFRASGTGAGVASVLFEHDKDPVVARDRTEFLEALDPQFAVAAFGVTEG